jgi:hypothetical protein
MKNYSFDTLLHGVGRYWFLIILFIFGVWILYSGDSSVPSETNTLPPPVVTTTQPPETEEVQPPKEVVSLPNGKVIKSNAKYLKGYGELEIDNGTMSDAVAKLIIDGTSAYTVYIKANSTYTIKNISNGEYRLAFVLGTDWDATTGTFLQSTEYSSFDEPFPFTVTEDATTTYYSTYQVTLNPIVGGTATTQIVDPTQFSQY